MGLRGHIGGLSEFFLPLPSHPGTGAFDPPLNSNHCAEIKLQGPANPHWYHSFPRTTPTVTSLHGIHRCRYRGGSWVYKGHSSHFDTRPHLNSQGHSLSDNDMITYKIALLGRVKLQWWKTQSYWYTVMHHEHHITVIPHNQHRHHHHSPLHICSVGSYHLACLCPWHLQAPCQFRYRELGELRRGHDYAIHWWIFHNQFSRMQVWVEGMTYS